MYGLFHFQKFGRGLANNVFKCHLKSDHTLEEALVVRVYGTVMNDFSAIRGSSPWVWMVADRIGLGSPVHATFTNGLVYGFAQGTPLTNEVKDDDKMLRWAMTFLVITTDLIMEKVS